MQVIGKAKVGNSEFTFWNNGWAVDGNGKPIGAFRERTDSGGNWDGTWDVWDTGGKFFANLNAQTSTITIADGNTIKYNWIPNNSYNGEDVRNPQKLDILHIGNTALQMMDNGGLYHNDTWVGYVEGGIDGSFDLKTTTGDDYCNIGKNGVVTGPGNKTWDTTATYGNHLGPSRPSRDVQMTGTVSTYGADGKPGIFQLGSDGRFYGQGETSPIGTYSYGATANTIDFKFMDGDTAGTLDYARGVFTAKNGEAVNAKYQGAEPPPSTAPYTSTTTSGQKISSRSRSSSSTGLDWSDPVAGAIQQPLIDSALALPGLARKAGTQAQEHYINSMEQAMGPAGFQGYLNSLAGDRMINSSIAAGTLANAQQQASQRIADQAFVASLAGTQAEMGVAGELSRILSSMGTKKTSSSSSGDSSSFNTQGTTISDPLAPYTAWTNRLGTA